MPEVARIRRRLAFAALCAAPLIAQGRAAPTPPAAPRDLQALLAEHPEPFADVLAHAREHRLQVLLAEPEEHGGRLRLRRSALGDPRCCFYPASAVKLGAAIAALLELQRLAGATGSRLEEDRHRRPALSC